MAIAFSDQYCDLHGFDQLKPYFTAHDHSNCSILRVKGCASITSASEYQARMAVAAQSLGALLRSPYRSMTITFERSHNNDEELARYRESMQRSAQAKRLNASVVTEEVLAVLKERLFHEEVLIACWTSLGAGYPEEVRREFAENKTTWGRVNAPGAMDPLVAVQSLEGVHLSFVSEVVEALHRAKITVDWLGQPTKKDAASQEVAARPDLAAVRRSMLFHETPEDWRPQTTFERTMFEVKDYETRDVSGLFAPPLAQQIMTSAATATSDMRSVSFGGRTFAVVHAALFPRRMPLFSMLSSKLERYDGQGEEDMPWRFAMHLTGGTKIGVLAETLNVLMSFMSPMNNQKRLGLNEVRAIANEDRETFVGVRMMAVTWIEPHETMEVLSARRSRLVRALEGWNSPSIVEVNADPLRALAETGAGVTRVQRTGRYTLGAITQLSLSLPFHRTAPIFESGQSVMISPEGKPIPLAAHSSEQNFWFSLISAPPGSGKSVYLNRTNLEFALFTPGAVLPFIGVIDIGPSSSGFIELLRSMAPDHMKHQMLLTKIRNDRHEGSSFINPFELSLGNRKPTDQQRQFIEAFVTEVLADEKRNVNPDFVSAIVKAVYSSLSDIDISSTPKRWQEGVCAEIDELCEELKFPLRETTRWWSIVDMLAERGMFREAMIAQRYASPLMDDLARVISREDIRNDFGADHCHTASMRIQGAIEQFPVFSRPTTLDIGEARICSIDLNDVVIKGGSPDRGVQRQNSLMYMMAAQLFLRQISGDEAVIPSMAFPEAMRDTYQTYWRKRFQDISETPKRFAMDEFHNTGSTPSIVNAVEVMVREGRKWGLEILLASQKIDDFEAFKELASTVVLLDATDNKTRDKLREQFGFSAAVSEQISKLHGPQPNLGGVFVIGAKLKTNYHWQRLYNHLAPTLLWALDTTAENRNLRKALVGKLGLERALKLLVARFPRGTAVDYVKQWKVDQSDEELSVYEEIAARLITDSIDVIAA